MRDIILLIIGASVGQIIGQATRILFPKTRDYLKQRAKSKRWKKRVCNWCDGSLANETYIYETSKGDLHGKCYHDMMRRTPQDRLRYKMDLAPPENGED